MHREIESIWWMCGDSACKNWNVWLPFHINNNTATVLQYVWYVCEVQLCKTRTKGIRWDPKHKGSWTFCMSCFFFLHHELVFLFTMCICLCFVYHVLSLFLCAHVPTPHLISPDICYLLFLDTVCLVKRFVYLSRVFWLVPCQVLLFPGFLLWIVAAFLVLFSDFMFSFLIVFLYLACCLCFVCLPDFCYFGSSWKKIALCFTPASCVVHLGPLLWYPWQKAFPNVN